MSAKHIVFGPRPIGDVEDEALREITRSVVWNALKELPRREREAVVLRYYDDLLDRQIAEVMGVSTGAVKAYLARGRQALRILLEAET